MGHVTLTTPILRVVYCVQLVLDAPLRMRVARPTVEIARRDSLSLDSALDAVS